MIRTLRTDLEPLPERMLHLPIDHRGYVVPWFVEWVPDQDGIPFPEFRAVSPHKIRYAVIKKLCWVCGKPLGAHKAFVVGPMCGVNRIAAEPPSHLECARWSARNCPFLSKPQMVRRTDETFEAMQEEPPGIMIERNPGVVLLWICKGYQVIGDGRGGKLCSLGDPESVEWYFQGRAATRAEVEESVRTGLPALTAFLPQDEDRRGVELALLDAGAAQLAKLYPAEAGA